jgi:DNA-binding transcriptional LysR family regulator
LRITAPVELGGGVLPEIISDFTLKYPKVTVELILTERRVDLLSESVDLAIRAGELKDSSLIAKKIGLAYFALFASPKYIKQNAQLSHPRELNRHKCLAFSPLGAESWRLVGPKGTLDVPIKAQVVANDLNIIKNIAMQNNGIAFLPVHLCQQESLQNKLVRVLPEWRSTMSPIHFVYPAQKFVMPKLSEFMKFSFEKLRESFEGGLS